MSNQIHQKIWRASQIAAQLLYRYFKDINIEYSQNENYDLIVSFNDGVKFGVEVKLSSYIKSKGFSKDLDYLLKIDFNNPSNRIPIVLFCVNESLETATFGLVLGWISSNPVIYKDFEFRKFTADNASLFETLIRSMCENISIISKGSWNVLNRITITKETLNGKIQKGDILYIRNIVGKYKPSIAKKKESLNSLRERRLQNDYIKDELDDIILDAIKSEYPNAELQSSLLLTSSDFERLQIYREMSRYSVQFLILPNINDANQIPMDYKFKQFSLEIYTLKSKFANTFDFMSFTYNIQSLNWIAKLANIYNLLPSLRKINDFLI